MSRLNTMARFEGPEEPKFYTHCSNYQCQEPLYDGDKVLKFDGDYFCSEECFVNCFAEVVILDEEEFIYG